MSWSAEEMGRLIGAVLSAVAVQQEVVGSIPTQGFSVALRGFSPEALSSRPIWRWRMAMVLAANGSLPLCDPAINW